MCRATSTLNRQLLAIGAALLLATSAHSAAHHDPPQLSYQVVGDAIDYTIQPGDNLIKLASRYGVGAAVLAADNGKTIDARWTAGDIMHIDNRHVVPQRLADGIVVNVPQRMVYYFEEGELTGSFPAAVGRMPPKWQTPLGKFRVWQIREDPVWRVPDAVREEAMQNGKVLASRVEPGPDNPLGDYWIGLNIGGIGIHGTNSPKSIYGFHTHGCVRLSPDDIDALYGLVNVGERGEAIYQPVLFALTSSGNVYLEVNHDSYKRGMGGFNYVRKLAAGEGITDLIDWDRAAEVVQREEGIARDVTRDSGGEFIWLLGWTD